MHILTYHLTNDSCNQQIIEEMMHTLYYFNLRPKVKPKETLEGTQQDLK